MLNNGDVDILDDHYVRNVGRLKEINICTIFCNNSFLFTFYDTGELRYKCTDRNALNVYV